MSTSPMLFASNASSITIDGKTVAGLQSIDFKLTRNRQNIHAISGEERLGAFYGALVITGSLKVKSSFDYLDKKMYEAVAGVKSFQIVVELQPQSQDKPIKKMTFDECYLEDKTFGMDATGVALSTYNFTATRVREE
jgi:hypothetical protein